MPARLPKAVPPDPPDIKQDAPRNPESDAPANPEPGARARFDSLTLLDWRRRVAALYAEIRASTDIAAAHRRWQEVRNDLFAHHPDSPLTPAARANFTRLPVADYDPAYRFVLEVDPEVAPRRLDVETGTDGVVSFERTGLLHVPGVGDLDVWWLATYGGGVFVPVRDRLAGSHTYGGGRYLIDTVKGADLGGDGRSLVVDLNFAYNPSCAYDPTWACPLAPPGNTVAAEIPVGELYPSPLGHGEPHQPD